MPVVTEEQALELLTNGVQEKLPPVEVLEVYNEVFPEDRYTEEQARQDPSRLKERLVQRIHSGLGIDEVIDLWGVVFPRDRNVWYNEEEERIHYNEDVEAVSSD
jgi:hypothetical protein